MASKDELLTTIDAKLSALLSLAAKDEPASAPEPRAWTPPATNGSTNVPSEITELRTALDEIARLLALNLGRKRDLADVVADLDAVGIDRDRIVELLGVSPSRVDAALVSYDRRGRKNRLR